MPDQFIQVPTDSTGKKVDTSELTVGANTVERQRIVIAADAVAAALAAVKNTAPAANDYGLTTRPILRKDAQTLSTTNLGISGEFAQAFQDGAENGVLFVEASARADVASATDGFKIEESDDTADTNFTVVTAQVTVSANTLTSIRAIIRRRYWRIKYTNGGTAQTSFRLTLSAVQAAVPEQSADFDTTGTQVQPVTLEGIALPGAGGPVIGGTSTNPLRTDPTGTTTQPVSDAAGSLTVDQATYANLKGNVKLRNPGDTADLGDATNPVRTDPTGTTTQPVSGTVTANAGTGDRSTVGNVAHDAVDSGNPVKIGGKVTTALPGTPPADLDRIDAGFDDHGRQIVRLNAPRARVVQNTITLSTTTETTLIAAGAAGVFRDLTHLTLSNTSGTAVRVDIRDATGGTVRYSIFLAATGGGAVVNFTVPFTQTTAANNWTAQLSAAVTDVRITAQAIETK